MDLQGLLYVLGIVVLIVFFLMILPFVMLIFSVLGTFFSLVIYKKIYRNDPDLVDNPRRFWAPPLAILAKIWRWHGRICHGYEIEGLENIPDEEGAILVGYHPMGAFDALYMLANVYRDKRRQIVSIVDRATYKGSEKSSFVEALELLPGTVDSCVRMVGEQRRLLLIYPGGMKENVLSDHSYQLFWPDSAGFGKVAFATKAKIIPFFTKNSRECTRHIGFLKGFFDNLYLTKKIPFLPVIGWFPVKIKTYFGKPVEYSLEASVEEIVQKTRNSLEDMIRQHQRIPGSIPKALLERFNWRQAIKSD